MPLYAVALGAAGLLLWQLVDGDSRTRELGIASWPLALYLVWTGFSVTWSVDLHTAAIDMLAFYVPFTILAVSIARLPWLKSRVRILYGELVVMALVFAVVGFYQYKTRTIFENTKLQQINTFQALFRVNSVFFDPSIYGRFLVVAIVATAVLLVRGGVSRRVGLGALAFIAVVWLGLLISFSQSSFAALFVAVFALAAIVWRWKSLLALAAVLVLGGRDRRDAATSDACAAAPDEIRAQQGDGREIDPDRGRDQDREERTRLTVSGSAASSTPTRSSPITRRRRAPRTTRRSRLLRRRAAPGYCSSSGSSGRCSWPRTGGSTTAPTGCSPSPPGLSLLAIFVHSNAYNDFFEDPTTWLLIGLIGLVSPVRVRARDWQPAETEEPVPEMIAG